MSTTIKSSVPTSERALYVEDDGDDTVRLTVEGDLHNIYAEISVHNTDLAAALNALPGWEVTYTPPTTDKEPPMTALPTHDVLPNMRDVRNWLPDSLKGEFDEVLAAHDERTRASAERTGLTLLSRVVANDPKLNTHTVLWEVRAQNSDMVVATGHMTFPNRITDKEPPMTDPTPAYKEGDWITATHPDGRAVSGQLRKSAGVVPALYVEVQRYVGDLERLGYTIRPGKPVIAVDTIVNILANGGRIVSHGVEQDAS